MPATTTLTACALVRRSKAHHVALASALPTTLTAPTCAGASLLLQAGVCPLPRLRRPCHPCCLHPRAQEQIFKMVLKGHIDFKTDPWPKLSDSCKACVRALLEQVGRAGEGGCVRQGLCVCVLHTGTLKNSQASRSQLTAHHSARLNRFVAGQCQLRQEPNEAAEAVRCQPRQEPKGGCAHVTLHWVLISVAQRVWPSVWPSCACPPSVSLCAILLAHALRLGPTFPPKPPPIPLLLAGKQLGAPAARDNSSQG